VARKYLPLEIVDAPKIGFGIEAPMWKGAEVLLKGGIVADLFKWESADLNRIYEMVTGNDMSIFHLVSMELWGRIFFRQEDPQQLGEKLLSLTADD
jgi:asparagine synthase (glutamine-hydrolysing)